MATIVDTSEIKKRRRLNPASAMLRRASRRSDIARKLRRRDVTSVMLGLMLGLAGLWMPKAIDHYRGGAVRAAVPISSDLSAQSTVVAIDPASPASPSATKLHRASDGLFYATALVNGERIRFLVDTGASVVTLTADDARKLDIMPESQTGHAETANGRATFGWTDIDTIEVAGKHVEDVRAAVLSKDAGVSLLGQNLLARLGTVRLKDDELLID